MSSAGIINFLMRNGQVLLLPNYSVDSNLYNSGLVIPKEGYEGATVDASARQNLTFDFIVNQIDSGIPLIMYFEDEQHFRLVVGYAYDSATNSQMLLMDNSQYDSAYREVYNFSDVQMNQVITFQYNN